MNLSVSFLFFTDQPCASFPSQFKLAQPALYNTGSASTESTNLELKNIQKISAFPLKGTALFFWSQFPLTMRYMVTGYINV